MIGILNSPLKYRIITDSKQLRKFLDLIQKEPKVVKNKLLFIDSILQSKPGTITSKLICYLIAMSNKLEVSIIFIKDKDTRIDRRIETFQTEKIELLFTELDIYKHIEK